MFQTYVPRIRYSLPMKRVIFLKTYDYIVFDKIVGRSIVGIDNFFASNRLNDKRIKKILYFKLSCSNRVITIIISNPIQ